MKALSVEAERPARVYLTGGATAVLLGWRKSTIDVDIDIVPEQDKLLRSISRLKEDLMINVELASPAHFIPELPGWKERSVFIAQEGHVGFYHYDFYAQALAKIERGHTQDVSDVEQMLQRGLIRPKLLRTLFEEIFESLYRYPAIDPESFRRAFEETLGASEEKGMGEAER